MRYGRVANRGWSSAHISDRQRACSAGCTQVIVKTLSENKAFQQFALRTAKKGGKVMSEVSAKAEQIKSSEVRCLSVPKSIVRWVLHRQVCSQARAVAVAMFLQTTAKTADSTKQGLRSVVDWVREDLSKVGTRKK